MNNEIILSFALLFGATIALISAVYLALNKKRELMNQSIKKQAQEFLDEEI